MTDVPRLKGSPMADATSKTSTTADSKQADKPAAGAAPRAGLAPAAGSSDPAVHQLLAGIQAAQMNDDKDAEKAAREDLRALGYE
jgi:hypothetical protein